MTDLNETPARPIAPAHAGVPPNRVRPAAQQAARVLAGTTVALLAWALFWPESPCGDPVCVVPRMSVEIELDALAGTPGLPLEVETDTGTVSARSVLATGGIEVSIRPDQDDIPYDAASGALDRADLYQIFEAWRSRSTTTAADARLYALITHDLVGDGGESLFGVMFDYGGREGFAIAPATVARRFPNESPELIAQLQVRTFIHELLHALNRYHSDAVQMPGGRLTLEAPTRCISRLDGTSLTLIEPPLFTLAPATIRYFQSAPLTEVLPGNGDVPFSLETRVMQSCLQARSTTAPAPAFSRWQMAMRRLDGLFIAAARAEGAEPDSGPRSPLVLELQALAASYPLGYPLAVRIVVTNTGEVPLPVRQRLAPAFHMLTIETRPEGSDEWRTFQPVALFEAADAEGEMLEPGARIEHTVPIHFGAEGWTFADPGAYEVRARLQTPGEFDDAESPVVTVSFAMPTATRDTEALQTITDDESRLRDDVGRLLAFAGRIDAEQAADRVADLTRRYPDTALGSAYRVALVPPMLRRRLDPATGTRAAPDPSNAARKLDDLCTDSGIAAQAQDMRAQAQSAGTLPDTGLEPDYVAWDGRAAGEARHVSTYSDPGLEPLADALHFPVGVAAVTDPSTARAIAAELRDMDPERVVLVGHADFRGDCRFNDALGMARAQAVARFLSRHGVDRSKIEIVSLGERRPRDFATDARAWAGNRRVEVLVGRDAQ